MRYLMYETTEYKIQTGGTARFREMCEYFQDKGITDIITQSGGFPDKPYIIQLDNNISKISLYRFLITKITMKNKNIIKQINSKEYDKVFVFDVPADIGLALLNVKHICLMIRKDLLDYKRLSLQSVKASKFKVFFWMIYLLVCESICVINAETIIVQCEYDKRILLQRHPLLRKMIRNKLLVQINNVNPTWIDKKSRVPLDENDPILDNKVFNICCVSGFSDKRKGADLIVEAFLNLYGNDPDYCLHMIGDGRDLENYRNNYKQFSNIVFWGRLQNPTKILRQCDLAVVPSRADSCPNTIMEAIYNSVPVIGSNAGGIPEILCDEDALFEVNSKSLMNKLNEVISEPNRLKEIQLRQMKRKQELTFNWVEQILKICS